MKAKLAIQDILDMFYTQKEQAEISGVNPSTYNIGLQNPDWPSTQQRTMFLEQHLRRELEHSQNSTDYPEHRKWVQATLRYMKTMELNNEEEDV